MATINTTQQHSRLLQTAGNDLFCEICAFGKNMLCRAETIVKLREAVYKTYKQLVSVDLFVATKMLVKKKVSRREVEWKWKYLKWK